MRRSLEQRILNAMLLGGIGAALSACGGSDGPKLPQLAAASPGTLQSCTDVATKAAPANTTIASATVVAAGGLAVAGITTPMPEHCLVKGEMNRRTSAVDGNIWTLITDGTRSHIRTGPGGRKKTPAPAEAAAGGNRTLVIALAGFAGTTLAAVFNLDGWSQLRLYDVTDGCVLVDGVDVRDYDPEMLWSLIGLVPQRPHLFSGTVADNLRYGKADATEDEMWAALDVASADFVAAHPSGLAMPVAQGGLNFSGGQRQRIAIARAVIRQPAIYLFDDAFSALDVHTDTRVRAALSSVADDATVVIVSQRLSTVVAADQIVVLDNGTVVGVGTHASLLQTCSVYREFVDSQALAVGGVS